MSCASWSVPCRLAALVTGIQCGVADPACWTAGFTEELCCDLAAGPLGNGACWLPEAGYTFERCCGSVVQEGPPAAQTHWHKSISNAPQMSIAALGLSGCAHVFHFGTASSRISRFVQFSGDPVRHLWKTSVGHTFGNKPGCKSINGSFWMVSAHIAGFPRGQEWGKGEPAFAKFQFCTPDVCSQEEAEGLASEFVLKHLEALSAIAVVRDVRAELHEDQALHFGWYMFSVLCLLTIFASFVEHLGGRRCPLSAWTALEDLVSERAEECLPCHILRAMCSFSVVLYHFHAEHYTYTFSFMFMNRFLHSWRILFFLLSFHLQTQHIAIGKYTWNSFAVRFWRKLQRQILLAAFFQVALALHNEEPVFKPTAKVLSEPCDWIDLFIFMEFNWQIAAELWQFLFVAALLLLEAQSVGLLYVSWGVLWSLVLPVFWGLEEQTVQIFSYPGRPFWTVRVPVSLVLFGVRHARWLPHIPLLLKFLCFMLAKFVISADLLAGFCAPCWHWFCYEVAFHLPLLLMLPTPGTSADWPQHSQIKSSIFGVMSRFAIAASRLAPLVMVLSGNQKVLEEAFRSCSLSMGMDWTHALIVQGPLLLVWCHAVCFFVWVFAYRPLLHLMEECACRVPQSVIQYIIVPGWLLILVVIIPRHSAPPLFQLLPWGSSSAS